MTFYITVNIYLFVNLLFVVVIIRATEFKVKELEIGASGKIPCEYFENNHDALLVQWYKSTSINEFENGDASLASWRKGESASQLNYHMENKTFSLVIGKTTLEDEGIYKCSVERNGSLIRSSYYIRTFIYALPRMAPNITLDPALNRVTCTVQHVRPLIYPVLHFDCSHARTETYGVLNEDGTYTTSVSCALPQTKSASRVDCSYSYLNYSEVGTLELSDITTESLVEIRKRTLSHLGTPTLGTYVIFAGDECRKIDNTAIIVCAVLISLLTVANFIMLIRRTKFWGKCQQGGHNSSAPEKSEMIRNKPTMVLGA